MKAAAAAVDVMTNLWRLVMDDSWWCPMCAAVFTGIGLVQIVASVLLAPFRRVAEVPQITCRDTTANRALLTACPGLMRFEPTIWAAGPHAQTLVAGVMGAMNAATSPYRRELVALPSNDRRLVHIALDWKEHVDTPGDAPLIFCCHGLGGSSESTYMQTFTHRALARRFRVVVYNRRGHAKDEPLTEVPTTTTTDVRLPSHWDEDDMTVAVDHVIAAYPESAGRRALIGFSLGGNLVCNYQARAGTDSPFSVAVSACNGYDLDRGTQLLARSRITDGLACSFLQGLLVRSPSVSSSSSLRRARSVRQFDAVTAIDAYGYRDLAHYYAEASRTSGSRSCVWPTGTTPLCTPSSRPWQCRPRASTRAS